MMFTFIDFLSMCKEFKLFEYLNGTDFSNRSCDILNLLRCNTKIRNLLKILVIHKGIFDWHKLNLFDKEELMKIKSISLSNNINHLEILKIVPNINCIRICSGLLGNIDHMLPTNLERLEFITEPTRNEYQKREYYDYRCKITSLPKTLKYLDAGNILFCPLEGILPESLEYLDLGYNYFNIVPHLLSNLKYFKSHKFNNLEINGFPPSITHMDLNAIDNYSNSNVIWPSSLTFLKLTRQVTNLDLKSLPQSLTHLEFDGNYDKQIYPNELPPKLKILKFTKYFNQTIEPGIFPNELESLTFNDSFCRCLSKDALPQSLLELTFGNDFNIRIKASVLPFNLKRLVFGKMFNSKINRDVLPKKLEYLKFGESFNQPLDPWTLPNGLQCLIFGNDWNQPLKQYIFPPNLSSITFGNKFNQIIEKDILPKNLKTLIFGQYYKYSIIHLLKELKQLKNLKIPPNYKHSFKYKNKIVKVCGMRRVCARETNK